ncbi:MAG: GIY-YIG nuclease family protein [Candidatus Peribacteraceae bacterium]|nr:GIY-YIG nuclease family protein [Candidatus Peribacteraceae bacterium]MDD5075429.1 GIY-YIG nuclease family protein [Candidatus Peribacteraceae bacterium]
MPHFFYLARCSDGSLYAGTCVHVKEREAKHNAGTGAKYTRSRRPVVIIHFEEFRTLSEARQREAEVKKWPKAKKEFLLESKHRHSHKCDGALAVAQV